MGPQLSDPKLIESRVSVTARLGAAGCVFAEDEAALLVSGAPDPAALDAMVARRERGEPLEHVLGWAEFDGLRIAIAPGVFVPRHRTELLVHRAVEATRGMSPRSPVVVDLCCGSGAIGTAIAAAVPEVDLHAVDLDPAAARCARRNVPGSVYQGDLVEPLPSALQGRVDLLVASTPYVPTDALTLMPREAQEHEPVVALDGGTDGLDVVRRVSAAALTWLGPAGVLLVEVSEPQAPQAAAMVAATGLTAWTEHSAQRDATVVLGTR